jgi:hypothetical protein
LVERYTVLGRQLDDGLARDAFEDAPGRRGDPVSPYREDVEARAFDDVVVVVREDRRLPAAVVGVVEAGYEVQPVVVL